MPYYTGEAIRLANWGGTTTGPTGGYRNEANALYDPSTVSLSYLLPGTTSATTVSGGGLVKDAVGLYHLNVTPSAPGTLIYAWKSSDGAYALATLEVQPAPI